MIDILAIIIILCATGISIAGAWLVSGTTSEGRRIGFSLWQWSNILWVLTFFMGLLGLITQTVFIIQQACAFTTFLIYFAANYRGVKNNGGI